MAQNPGGRPAGLAPNGAKVRRLRLQRGLPIGKLAAQVGCHRETISRIERKNIPFSDVMASRLALALTQAGRRCGLEEPDVSAADLLQDPSQFKDGDEDELRPTG